MVESKQANVKLEPSWKAALRDEFSKPYFSALSEFVRSEYKKRTVYPKPADIFRAFDLCSFEDVRVVIIGQDPYHGPHQANGLSFAVQSGMKLPPSLQNIFKEIKNDLGQDPIQDGELTRWRNKAFFCSMPP